MGALPTALQRAMLARAEAQAAQCQVSRAGDVAMYRQTHKEGSAERFAVIVVQHFEERPMPGGGTREAGEYYPSSSQWGKTGWTCLTLAEAQSLARTLATRGPADEALEDSDAPD